MCCFDVTNPTESSLPLCIFHPTLYLFSCLAFSEVVFFLKDKKHFCIDENCQPIGFTISDFGGYVILARGLPNQYLYICFLVEFPWEDSCNCLLGDRSLPLGDGEGRVGGESHPITRHRAPFIPPHFSWMLNPQAWFCLVFQSQNIYWPSSLERKLQTSGRVW